MLVVSDTSPLNLLIQIDAIHALPTLFGEIRIPDEVAAELAHHNAPASVQSFIANPPSWLITQMPTTYLTLPQLDVGEVAAISLAKELGAIVLMDERDGRQVAQAHGLTVVGVVGILERAADQNIIVDLAAAHVQIRGLQFHIAEAILDDSLRRHMANKAKD